ncbi:MAG: YHS domain-containing protein [Deltaproteobacteria bacterium]|nr:YHS domain-containing protein [Deltaproteobacteria bacterium]
MWIRYIALAALTYLGVKTFTWVYRSLTSLNYSQAQEGQESARTIDDMVKDPVCGVYVPYSQAFTAEHDGRTVYFCSRECRDKYAHLG